MNSVVLEPSSSPKLSVDQHPQLISIRHGKALQRTLAWDLHREANVPLGPCSYDALTAFSQTPSLSRLPDPVGGCRPVFSHHNLWSPSRQTIDPVASPRPLRCHHQVAWIFRGQLRLCPLLETLQPPKGHHRCTTRKRAMRGLSSKRVP